MARLGLRGKLLTAVYLVVAAGFAISTVAAYLVASRQISREVTNGAALITQLSANSADSWVRDRKLDLEQWGQLKACSGAFGTGYLADRYKVGASEAFERFVSTYGYYQSIELLDLDGKVLASSTHRAEGAARTLGADWQGLGLHKQDGSPKVRVSDILTGPHTGKPFFALCAPVLPEMKKDDKEPGKPLGMVCALVDLSAFARLFVEPLTEGKDKYGVLLHPKGILLSHPDRERILKNAGENESTVFLQTVVSQPENVARQVSGEQTLLCARARLAELGWTLVLAADENAKLSGLKLLRAYGVGTALLCLLITAVVVFLVITPAVRRIRAGRDLALTIQRGDLRRRMEQTGNDEASELAAALNSMAEGLQEKARVAEAIAAGDLTSEITLSSEEDMLGRALAGMTGQLNDLIQQIQSLSIRVAEGAGEISNASLSLSQQATEQAASVQEISSTLSEVSNQARSNAENAEQARNLSSQTREAAERGNTHMSEMMEAMHGLSASADQIAKIIKAIDDVAFQTNLLALNAAVEAARAGRHGKGFAVVAEEVRNLAGRSAKAARETSELIENTIRKMRNSEQIAERTNTGLQQIVQSVGHTTTLIGEITVASHEQACAVDQINSGVGQIELATQQNSANSEETASAAQELTSLSKELRELLGRFRLRGTSDSSREIARSDF